MSRTKAAVKAAKTKARTNKAPVVQSKPQDTREDLILKMGDLLDKVDQLLPGLSEYTNWSYPHGTLAKPREQAGDLERRMNALLAHDSDETAYDIFWKASQVEPGTIPAGARPGQFVMWIGYVPILCIWSGFISRMGSDLRVVDPCEMWISKTGYRSFTVGSPRKGVEALFREHLTAMVQAKDFDLQPIEPYARDQAVRQLAEFPWLQTVLDKGATDPIALPPRFASVQQGLF
jgi:hypothetical protein